MPVTVTVAPSPKRRKSLRAPEAQYLVDLATQIAEDHPQATVLARYGERQDEVLLIRKTGDEDTELF
ncbi:MAG: hypothetical protein NVV74_10915 [Magnetospirillum sp.]|nr:hypothetical protein [Magnetospirillum sp.]